MRALPEEAALSRAPGEEWDGWTVLTEMAATTVDMLAILVARRQLPKPFRVERPARIDPAGAAAREKRARQRRARNMVALEHRTLRPEGDFAREIFGALPGVPMSVFAPAAAPEPVAAAPAARRPAYDPNFARKVFGGLPGVPGAVFGATL